MSKVPGSHWKKLERTTKPTAQDIAYAAGFYDGEGCCYPTFDSPTRTVPWPRNSGQYVYFGWTIYSARARGFLMTIYKFLSSRRQAKIREAIGKHE